MDYGLARRLEVASFPYREDMAHLECQPFDQFYPRARIPTFLELEGALGDIRQKEKWSYRFGKFSHGVDKKNLIELAKLWLALNPIKLRE